MGLLYLEITKAILLQIHQTTASAYTAHSKNLHLTQTNSVIYQKEVFYSGVAIFSNLLSDIKNTNFKTFFYYTPFLHLGEILYQMIHVANDSVSIIISILLNFYLIFNLTF
jgi:hypothetical protein